MSSQRTIMLRSIGRGQHSTRFPWAGRAPRDPQRAEPMRYRCGKCRMRFRSSTVIRVCPTRSCGGAVVSLEAR